MTNETKKTMRLSRPVSWLIFAAIFAVWLLSEVLRLQYVQFHFRWLGVVNLLLLLAWVSWAYVGLKISRKK